MSLGCPVISYDNSSITEAAGDAAVLIKTGDLVALTSALTQVLTDPSLQTQLREKGLKRAQQFSWHNYAKELLSILRA